MFCVNVSNREVLDGDAFVTHTASHGLALEDLLWESATDGTDLADISLETVRIAGFLVVMTLDGTSETFTFAGASNLDFVSECEFADS